ncbi:phosphate ABC transporter permease subunit PstC [Ligilactobacillus equi]|uniref:Phosphate transport system permease protein n=1 Tax=Ligilactobacillus equi DSM 15833 = JCM 10991 TaxID=1423740 RepID=A0A0R1TPK9_9LACO|nr:phosphate ABC transporter permease subunit PstC [Ligilactobacillus equi]KRL81892.1 phosphate ABC transporter permease [Ligilactobacillus equi DSM 15833 = JCM 10991]
MRQKREELWGKTLTGLAIGLVCFLVLAILIFVGAKGLTMFIQDKMSLREFFFAGHWDPAHQEVGALGMLVTSFLVTLTAAVIASPLALVLAIYVSELASGKIAKFIQPLIEILVGVPSVVYGLLGLEIIVPLVRTTFGGTGFSILTGVLVLTLMILPTVTSLMIDALKAVPKHYRQASLALGATQVQTINKIVLKAAKPALLTAVIFGMTRAFGEALAVQMVIGNVLQVPNSLLSQGSTLTSTLTMGIGNTIFGTLPNNALWSLALILLLMSLIFNLLIRLVSKGAKK